MVTSGTYEWYPPRWARCEIDFRKRGQGIASDTLIEDLPKFVCHNRSTVSGNEPRKELLSVGACIYCGDQVGLSEEHIIPEGLGARLVLPAASCQECAKKTTRIEGAVLRGLLRAPRASLGIRGKRRRRSDKGFALATRVGSQEFQLQLPLHAHPTMLFLPSLNAPGVLVGRSPSDSGVQGYWLRELGDFNDVARRGLRNFMSPRLDSVRFCQLLAKIAHAYAVSVFGLQNFKPTLTSFIRDEFDDPKSDYREKYYYVGGDSTKYAASNDLHEIGWGVSVDGSTMYLVVALRLFAYLGAPVYQVVVGEPLEKFKAEISLS